MNRREFLQGTAALGLTGSIVTPTAFGARVNPVKSELFSNTDLGNANPRFVRYRANHKRWTQEEKLTKGVGDIVWKTQNFFGLKNPPGSFYCAGLPLMLVFGDFFWETEEFRRSLDGKSSPDLDMHSMYRIETIHGKLVEYQFVPNWGGPDYVSLSNTPIDRMPSAQMQKSHRRGEPKSVVRYRPSEVVHLRLLPTKDTYPYGSSYGELLDQGYTHEEILIKTLRLFDDTRSALV